MPIVFEGEVCKMKLNGYDNFKQSTNGANDAQNFPSGMFDSDVPECSLCKERFNSLKDFETHSISLEHVQKVLAKNSLISVSSDVHSAVTSGNEKMCVDKIDKQEQLEKNSSSSKTDDVILDEKTMKPPKLPFYCSLCIMKFTGPEPYKQHLESKSHKKKDLLDRNSLADIKKIDGHIFCDVCNIECTGEKPYQEHLFSKKHKIMEQRLQFLNENPGEDFASTVKKIKIECMPETDKQFFCDICEIQCSGSVPYNQHLGGNAHKKNIARSKAGVNIEPSTYQFQSLQDYNSNIHGDNNASTKDSDLAFVKNMKHSLQLVKEGADEDSAPKAKKMKIELISEKEKQWFCKTCLIQCSGSVPWSQHIIGNAHKRNVDRSQAGGNIEPSINQSDRLLPINNNMDHVNVATKDVSDSASVEDISDVSLTVEKINFEKEEEKIKIDKSKPAWFCKICNVQSNGPIDFSIHLGGKSHKKKFDLYQKSINITQLKDSIDFYGTKTNVNNNLTEESSHLSQKLNLCSENIDYERELKKSVAMFTPDDEINFD